MQHHPEAEHQAPGRIESALFFLKTRAFIARRWWQERSEPVSRHSHGVKWRGAPQIGHAKAALWTQLTPAEFPLTAGKVQNLRASCRRLHGIEVPAGEVFSFWKQLGRTTRTRGFTTGRELRSGCLVPNLGGGLCQLSGLLHAAALEAGIEVVERHEHSRTLPGTPLPPERDATVFWNYVDLRFRAPFAWRLEVRLTATDLVVVIRAVTPSRRHEDRAAEVPLGVPVRAAADGDCLTCGVTSCFRHPSATKNNAPASGHTGFVLDGLWPEFDDWCHRHSKPGDRWYTPLDGHRWKKPNYSWNPPPETPVYHATCETLVRSWRQRKLPSQGPLRQQFLLDAQRQLAEQLGRHLDPQARHLIVSQTLLPHLWKAGYLGGRTFDVLMNRWPLAELQHRLDTAAEKHQDSDTLADFRADPELVHAESEALSAAARLITPHRAIAARFGHRALLLDWVIPAISPRREPTPDDEPKWFFPSSALGRKGIYELAEAMQDLDGELLVLGRASEGATNPLDGIRCRSASVDEIPHCTALILPAWVEHEPRLALRALASGVPVIATRDCGLPSHPLLVEIEAGDAGALREAMEGCIGSLQTCAVA
ncbi:MAG: VanW family protein [Luteolibacter sp.]